MNILNKMWDFLVTMEGLWRVREKVQRGCYCRPLPSLLRMLAENGHCSVRVATATQIVVG